MSYRVVTRRKAIRSMAAAAAAPVAVLAAPPPAARRPRFVAFSLRAAFDRARRSPRDPVLTAVGQITRLAGLVYDVQRQDVILVGLACPELPAARFDDLVVALRARLVHDEFPLVSIDPVAGTQRTRRQRVRFVGHLEDTPFGADFLACDVLLKRYSLQLVDPLPAVPSYNRLLEQQITRRLRREGVTVRQARWHAGGAGGAVSKRYHGSRVQRAESHVARFWFFVVLPYNTACKPSKERPEFFCIRELKLCLQSEDLLRTGGPVTHDGAREQFAANWTRHFAELTDAHPRLLKLKLLYDMVAAADVVKQIDQNVRRQQYLRTGLANYRPQASPTPRTYPLEETLGVLQRSDGRQHLIHISGGIQFLPDLEDTIENLNYGILPALRTIVLRSRPDPNCLAWRVPLEGWHMPNADRLSLPRAADRKWFAQAAARGELPPGCSLAAQSVVLERDGAAAGGAGRRFFGFEPAAAVRPLGGVSMEMRVTDGSFLPARDQSLRKLRDQILRSRPGRDALTWPIGRGPKGDSAP